MTSSRKGSARTLILMRQPTYYNPEYLRPPIFIRRRNSLVGVAVNGNKDAFSNAMRSTADGVLLASCGGWAGGACRWRQWRPGEDHPSIRAQNFNLEKIN
jgi:hypothetical protein